MAGKKGCSGIYTRTKPVWNKGLTKETDIRVAIGAQHSSKPRKNTNNMKIPKTAIAKINIKIAAKKRFENPLERENNSIKAKNAWKIPKIREKYISAAIRKMGREILNGTAKWMNTDIEMLMYEGLLSEGYLIEKQHYVNKLRHRADFYLPEHNIIIECDGEYWHNNLKNFEKDEEQTKKMIEFGYKVLRFEGKEIKNNLKKCLNKIKEVVYDSF